MIDGKMVTALLGLWGAYCTMCTKSQVDCQKLETIEEGFVIDKNVEQLSDQALSLTYPDTNEIIKQKCDYKTRQGVCSQPITQSDITKTIPVCHAKIRTFEFVIEFLVRLLSHQKWWTPTNQTTYTKEEKEQYRLAWEKIKDDL